jgi:DNA-binding IclR family transcriptional regulator
VSNKRRSTRNRRFAVQVLASLTCRPTHEWTASELAFHSGMHPNSVSIAIVELLNHGAIEQIPGEPKRYRLTDKDLSETVDAGQRAHRRAI